MQNARWRSCIPRAEGVPGPGFYDSMIKNWPDAAKPPRLSTIVVRRTDGKPMGA